MEPARLGLIGAGRWGRAYIRTIASLKIASLAAVASSNPETRSLVPADCIVTPDWRALTTLPGIDAIIVATPPAFHHEMAMAALEAGRPVLVEKPFTCDLAQAEAIASLARHKALAVMVEHTHLFAPAFRALAERIPALGGVRAIRGRANAEGPVRPDVSVLWDWGPHDVAMCIDLLGPPQRQSARRLERRAGVDHAERIAVALEWPEGVAADIECSNITAPKRRLFEVECRHGTLVYDDLAASKLTHVRKGGIVEPIAIAAEPPLTTALREFIAAIARPPNPRPLALACNVVRVLGMCEASMEAGVTG